MAQEFKDGIPEEPELLLHLKHHPDERDKYKCSESFFNRLDYACVMLGSRGAIKDEETLDRVRRMREYIGRIKAEKFPIRMFADIEDVQEINSFLKYMISKLHQSSKESNK